MRIFAAQLNPIVGDLSGNAEKILEAIEEGRSHRANLLLFSELVICGYPPEDLVFHHSFLESISLHLERIVMSSRGIGVILGIVRKNDSPGEKGLLNSAALIYDQAIVGFYDKQLLPTYDLFNESRYFAPGEKNAIWEIFGKKIAISICEDAWQHAGYVEWTTYQSDPILELLPHHPDLFLNLAASPYHFEKRHRKIEVCKKVAKTLHCPVVMCCQIGANGPIIFDGYSCYVDDQGELRQTGKGFQEDHLLIDLKTPPSSFSLPENPLEDLLHALILGVKDYANKSGFSQACIGLSGGIDSSLVAYIATRALGPNNVIGISMPSIYTRQASLQDGQMLASRLGIAYLEIPIHSSLDSFLSLLQPYFQNKKENATEENIQARIRAIILMALSNKHGYLLLNTGNKSEIALGYTTLYGDMCGGIGVIGDVLKTQVVALCHYINEIEGKETILESIISRPPSAELRFDQKDLDSLPEYGIIDRVLQEYVENYLSIEEIVQKHHLSRDLVVDLITKIHQAEYKRRQGPPILRVSKKSFGIGYQYPIVQKWMRYR